ncbi:MAG: 2-oxo acid dehydrogenase subunit E2 [Deltaproteobacteria bacterium]|nr:2-oxo acid dehydrogenase subunit E2 [Deltaproteobacteria bacterium]
MKVEMIMPQMGESIAEATILKWLKSVGDKVTKDETILEISTDKVDSEIPAPETGTLVELKATEGEVVPVRSIIAVIDTEASGAAAVTAPKPAAKPQPAQATPLAAKASVETKSIAATPVAMEEHEDTGRFYSPLVKSLSEQHNVTLGELDTIHGSGAGGRVTKGDLMEYLKNRDSVASSKPQAAHKTPSAGAAVATASPTARPSYGPDGLFVEKMSNMRQKIAEHMVRSNATSPHVYSTAEVDVTNIARWRNANQSQMVAREGFKLSFTPFFLEAAVKALIEYPYVNASIEQDNIILKKNINLGCAVALGETGLIVPVIHNAAELNLVGIAKALNDLTTRARNKQLKPEDVQGGTFTVTNAGVYGSILGAPIINQPQLAILSIGAIKKRPVVINDMIAIRDIVYITLGYDHRLIDGALGGKFLQFITKYLESWSDDRKL